MTFRSYRYFICDVFAQSRFGGNQLAVLTDARGLSGTQMQQIAREFNFSESAFVFPPEQGNTCRLRIFTPEQEIPFAGHPNIGTAFVLASMGEIEQSSGTAKFIFEEMAGLVPISMCRTDAGEVWCELKAPESFSQGHAAAPELVAEALSLPVEAISTDAHLPVEASVGLPFLIAEVDSMEALRLSRARPEVMEKLRDQGTTGDIHVYFRSADEFDIRTRMFAPLNGIAEDPATGSANCALAGLLAQHEKALSGDFQYRIAQGIEMGRPSLLDARAEKHNGKVVNTWVGGQSIMVSEGMIQID